MENEYYEITIGSTNRDDLERIRYHITEVLKWDDPLKFPRLDVENIIQRCEHGVNITYDTCDDAPCTPSGYPSWRLYKSL